MLIKSSMRTNSTSMTLSSNLTESTIRVSLPNQQKTIRVYLPNQQKTTVLIKNGLTIKDALEKKLSSRGFQSAMCDIEVLNHNRKANWNDDISEFEDQEIQIKIKEQRFSDLNATTYQNTSPVTKPLPANMIRVYLPNDQRTTILARRGDSVKKALKKSLDRHVLPPSICNISVRNQQDCKVDWSDDILKYKDQELQITIKESCQVSVLISHNLEKKRFFRNFTYCDVCSNLLVAGFRCTSCGFKFHPKCAKQLPPLCKQYIDTQARSNSTPNVLDLIENYTRSNHDVESFEDWEIESDEILTGPKIGSGSFGTVYVGSWHGKVALKKLNVKNPTPDQLEAFKNEVTVLRKTRHGNILLFMGCVSKDDQLTIVTEYCQGSSLFKHLHVLESEFELKQCVDISRQIAQGMRYLHSKAILHRDLKSQNVFLREDLTVKIGDFGLATLKTKWNEASKSIATGSILWMAPEIIRMKDAESFTFKSDVYAYGIVLYEIFSRELPYRKGDKNSLNNQIDNQLILYFVATGKLKPDLNKCRKDAPKMMIKLIEDCIKFSKDERPLFDQILNIIELLLNSMPKISRSLSEPSLNINQSNISWDIFWLTAFSNSKNNTPANHNQFQTHFF